MKTGDTFTATIEGQAVVRTIIMAVGRWVWFNDSRNGEQSVNILTWWKWRNKHNAKKN